MENVVAAAKRIEKILEEQTDSKMERLISPMQDQIRLIKKDLNLRSFLRSLILRFLTMPANKLPPQLPL